MKAVLFSLIGLSLLQSILLLLIRDEHFEKILKLICGVAMASVLVAGVSEFDYQTYAASLQRERADIRWDADSVKEEVDALHRRYIEAQCEAYILENASRMQIELTEVDVFLAWNTEGYWYPVQAEITAADSKEDVTALKSLIESELGIPIGEQIWKCEDGQP